MDERWEKVLDQLCYSWWDRIHNHNKNLIIFLTGESGGGKSWVGMSLSSRIDKTFWPTTHMTWTAMEFMGTVDSGEFHKGSMLISDETGIALPKREWYSIFNRKVNAVLQTFRHENIGVIFIAPTLKDFIDSQTQKLGQFYLEVTGINEKKRYAWVKVRKIEVNRITGKPYFKYPKVNIDGKDKWVNRMKVPAPSQEMIDAYEPLAMQKKKKLKHESYQALIDHEAKRNEVKEDKLTMINRLANEAVAKGMRKPTIYSIIAEFGCSEMIARAVRDKVLSGAGSGGGASIAL